MAELELLEPHHRVAARRQVPGRAGAERAEPDDDVVDVTAVIAPSEPVTSRSSRGSSQRRMSAESSSIGANQPWV